MAATATGRKLGGWLQNIGSRYNLPELKLSELFGVGEAQAEESSAYDQSLIDSGEYKRVYNPDGSQSIVKVTQPAIYPQKPAGYVSQEDQINQLLGSLTGSGTGSGTTTPEYVPNTQSFLGTNYDLNNPDQLAAYLSVKKDYVDALNREKLALIDQAFSKMTGGTSRDVNLENVGGEFGRQKTSFLDRIMDALKEYDTNETRDLGDIGAYYSGLGLSQSSQGVREGITKGKYTDARQETEKSKTEGLGELERSLTDYLGEDTQNRTSLARSYQGTLDDLQNTIQEDIEAKMNVPITIKEQYSGTVPTAYKETVARNENLLSSLKNAGNMFRNFGTSGGSENTNALLQYLYGR